MMVQHAAPLGTVGGTRNENHGKGLKGQQWSSGLATELVSTEISQNKMDRYLIFNARSQNESKEKKKKRKKPRSKKKESRSDKH